MQLLVGPGLRTWSSSVLWVAVLAPAAAREEGDTRQPASQRHISSGPQRSDKCRSRIALTSAFPTPNTPACPRPSYRPMGHFLCLRFEQFNSGPELMNRFVTQHDFPLT